MGLKKSFLVLFILFVFVSNVFAFSFSAKQVYSIQEFISFADKIDLPREWFPVEVKAYMDYKHSLEEKQRIFNRNKMLSLLGGN